MQKIATNLTIYNLINDIAPFESQESYDNSGFLIGSINDEVKNILVALDATPQVITEAINKEVQLLITHHPLLFHAIREINTEGYDGSLLVQLINSGISLISAHTNLDLTSLSGGAAIARKLSLQNIRQSMDPFLFLGDLPKVMTAGALGKLIGELLGTRLRCYGSLDKEITTLSIAGGAYDLGYPKAISAGAQALLTGEVRYHHAIAASQSDFVLFDGGHYQTEVPMMGELTDYLQNKLHELQYSVKVYLSECHHHSEGYTL
ncbi:MAG: Nif3-like dinuclear metal center hexameric protein [Clostridiales bacterium]|nr:Nif3-like dinuclear metal center hexameric protein [Clostridiales bacterium]